MPPPFRSGESVNPHESNRLARGAKQPSFHKCPYYLVDLLCWINHLSVMSEDSPTHIGCQCCDPLHVTRMDMIREGQGNSKRVAHQY